MALVEENAIDDALDGLINRGILEDNVSGLSSELKREFYNDLGKGLWDVAFKMFLSILFGIAAYGATKGVTFK
jgi:hypothetical protein